MKSLTPRKIDRNQECENMDLEYETKDSRYDQVCFEVIFLIGTLVAKL